MKRLTLYPMVAAILAAAGIAGLSGGAATYSLGHDQHAVAAQQQSLTVAASRIPLQSDDSVVAGALGAGGGVWLLAREGATQLLVAYSFMPGNAAVRYPLGIGAAGMLGAIVARDSGDVWAAADFTVVHLDPSSGTTQMIALPQPLRAVATATRSPSGDVLGLGQVTSLAVDATGSVWIARYAVPALTVLDARSGVLRTVDLPEDYDVSELVSQGAYIWFDVNHGPTNDLGAVFGRIDASGKVELAHEPALAIAAGQATVHVTGTAWRMINQTTLRTSVVVPALTALDLRRIAITHSGELVARVLRDTTLLVIDATGRTVKSITYDAGTISVRGKEIPATAPLAFIGVSGDTIWFAPRGDRAVYLSR